MTWYAVHQNSDGKLLSVGTVLPKGGLRRGVTAKSYGDTRPDTRGMRWNPALRDFEDRTAELPEAILEAEVKRRTPAEYDELLASAETLKAAGFGEASVISAELARLRSR